MKSAEDRIRDLFFQSMNFKFSTRLISGVEVLKILEEAKEELIKCYEDDADSRTIKTILGKFETG